MAKECFCGCGRTVGFGRKRATNFYGAKFDELVRIFEGGAARATDPAEAHRLRELAAEGRRGREELRAVVHGELDRKQMQKDRWQAWLKEATDVRVALAKAVPTDYKGWSQFDNSELLLTGRRAPAVVVDVRDTGATLNESPRVALTIRVEPEGEAPWEFEHKTFVSRVNVPRPGERLEVVYDPEDRERITFREAELTDDAPAAPAAAPAPPDPLERLEKLNALRRDGALTQEEFEAQKAKILAEL